MATTHQNRKTNSGLTDKHRQMVAFESSKLLAGENILLRKHEKRPGMSKEQISMENIRFFLEST